MNATGQADTATAQVNVPELKPVESSQIFAIGYDQITRTLAIQFVSHAGGQRNAGSIYTYSNVPLETAIAFTQAESIGKFFGANIKGKFEFRKVS